jgi:release factor glutamine methyltransferase
VRTRRGDLFSAVAGETFDLIATNPPYVRDGRALLDPICSAAHRHLRPGGALLVIHSEVCGIRDTQSALASNGLDVDVVLRHRGPLGPILRERVTQLWGEGRLPSGSMEEEIVVVRGRVPAATGALVASAG